MTFGGSHGSKLRRHQRFCPKPLNRIDFTVSNGKRQVYSNVMLNKSRKIRSTVVLALLLVVGPLQAQVLFDCGMMGVMIEECCCDDLDGAKDQSVARADVNPCCEQVVEVRADPDAPDVVKPVEVRSDVDPPTSIVSCSFVLSPSVIVHHLNIQWDDHSQLASGRQTYLTTQRLRI